MKNLILVSVLMLSAETASAQCDNSSCAAPSRSVRVTRQTRQTFTYQPQVVQWTPQVVQPAKVVVSPPVTTEKVEVIEQHKGLFHLIRERRQGRLAAHDADWDAAVVALDEVNELRATHGLKPFIEDEGLTRAAVSVSIFRARRQIRGHTSNDFAAMPPETTYKASGCAAWTPDWGWGSCCDGVHTDDHGAQYAGAAWTLGQDGRRYMHLFVR